MPCEPRTLRFLATLGYGVGVASRTSGSPAACSSSLRFRLGRKLPRSAVLAPALIVLSLLSPNVAEAGGFHITILGVKRTSMGTTVAAPDDTTALFHNPAGLADQLGTRVHISNGVTLLGNEAKLQALDPIRFPEVNAPRCGQPSEPPCRVGIGTDGYYVDNLSPESAIGVLPYIGASRDLSMLELPQVVFSLAAYAPGAYGATFSDTSPTAYYIIDGLFVIGAVTAGAGWRLNDVISVGANVSYNYMRLGYAQKFSTIDVLTPAGGMPDVEAGLAQIAIGDLRIDYVGTDHGFGWCLGALFTPTDWLSFGASYQGFTAATFSGDVELRGVGSVNNGTSPTSPAELRQIVGDLDIKLPTGLEVEMPIPPAFAIGSNVEVAPWLQLGVDLRLWLYTIFKRQVRRPTYGDEPGSEAITEESLSSDKNYSNSYQLNAGFLVAPLEERSSLELMGGVSFDKSPVPDETFSIDNPSLDQLSFSVGLRSELWKGWRLGASYMYTKYLDRDVTTSQTSPPTNVRITGESHIPTLEVEAFF